MDWFDASPYPEEASPRRPSTPGERIDYGSIPACVAGDPCLDQV